MTEARTRPAATTLAPLRVMQLISALAVSEDGLTLAQASAQAELPKSSALSLLRTLHTGGYVTVVEGTWRLGQESYALGRQLMRGRPFAAATRPLLARMHQECGESVFIGVPSQDWSEVVYVDVIESAQMLRFKVEVGSRDPAYCTSLGLVMLAFAPQAWRTQVLASAPFQRHTPDTITSRTKLLRLLEAVKSDMVGVSRGMLNLNVSGISAPVFRADGALVAGVGLSGLSQDIDKRQAKLRELVHSTGAAMSARLGCASYPPPAAA